MANHYTSTVVSSLLMILVITNHLLLLSPFTISNATKPTTQDFPGFTLELIHRDSPSSPLYPGNLTQSERIQRLVAFTNARADQLASYNSFLGTDETHIRDLPIHHNGFIYIVKLSIGTPPITYHLILDTGSHITWVQCAGSNPSFPQTAVPLFNPRSSRTSSLVPCSSPLRQGLQCIDGKCFYTLRYVGGKAVTKGFLYKDTIWFNNKRGGQEPIPDLAFGCSHESERFTMFQDKINGIMGMNQAVQSIISQLGPPVMSRRRFSYCLAEEPGAASLRFGSEAVMKERNAVTTPLVRGYRNGLYYLNLVDVGLNGQQLRFPEGTFGTRRDGTGGLFVDSGASMTVLIRDAYDRLTGTLGKQFERRGFERVDGREHGMPFDHCWKLYNVDALPSLSLHFEGGVLSVKRNNLFLFADNPFRFFCLAMGPHDSVSILGAKQQQDVRFVFDLELQQLKFASADCKKNP